MKKYRKPGTCEMCFWGQDAYYNREDAKCGWHEDKPIKFGQNKCNQFIRADWAKKK